MDIIYRDLPNPDNFLLPSGIDDPSEVLFIDVETTGFSARISKLYLIGCAFYSEGHWRSAQFFADRYSDEEEILKEFIDFSKPFKYLIHFNGSTFDIPYLTAKFREYHISFNFERFTGFDIYKQVSKLKSFLLLEDCKQKSVEKFLRLSRDDKYSGGELVDIYKQYALDGDPQKKELLLLHNYEDVLGMPKITPILAYSDLFNELPTVNKVYENCVPDSEGGLINEVIIEFTPHTEVPVPVSSHKDGLYITVNEDRGLLKVPIYQGGLKYFFANHEDYYYLPAEDMAIHKSVASFVDKGFRQQAKASNCYTKKESSFLPQWDELTSPIFKPDHKSKDLYFELTDEIKNDRDFFARYTKHLINRFL
ncbi:MAG: ribonuclease H-like domain-containing protein [Lachnospiraceae bacterium]|nr:ribonuclease H-like domain-containing protein [Lachnospiraceae bacterium]